jgi:hypothetical protein
VGLEAYYMVLARCSVKCECDTSIMNSNPITSVSSSFYLFDERSEIKDIIVNIYHFHFPKPGSRFISWSILLELLQLILQNFYYLLGGT